MCNTKYYLFIITSILFFSAVTLESCKTQPIHKLIVEDSLYLNLSIYKEKATKFLTSKKSKSINKLFITNLNGWVSYSFYTLNGETNLRVGDLEKAKGYVEAAQFIKDIGNLKNLKVLSLSTLNLKQLPSSITQLKNLEDLDIGFNNKLNWNEVTPKLKELPGLKVIRLYGLQVDQETYNRLEEIKPDLKIRFTLDHFKEDITKLYKTETYRYQE